MQYMVNQDWRVFAKQRVLQEKDGRVESTTHSKNTVWRWPW